MGLLNWLKGGDQDQQREVEADRLRQAQLDAQREAAHERMAAKLQQARADRARPGTGRQRSFA